MWPNSVLDVRSAKIVAGSHKEGTFDIPSSYACPIQQNSYGHSWTATRDEGVPPIYLDRSVTMEQGSKKPSSSAPPDACESLWSLHIPSTLDKTSGVNTPCSMSRTHLQTLLFIFLFLVESLPDLMLETLGWNTLTSKIVSCRTLHLAPTFAFSEAE